MKRFLNITFIVLMDFLITSLVFAQGQIYQGPEDPAGDKGAEREGYMTGNRVFLYFQNTTELAKWVSVGDPPLWSKWPNNTDGVKMLDGVGLLIGAKVYVIENDTIPVTNRADIDNGVVFHEGELRNIVPLHFLQTSYREEMDMNDFRTIEWGLYPVFGYFNELSEYPAMSNIETSWPHAWPASGNSTKWDGEWNGRFGRGVIYADLETYFVANDAQDQEYLGIEDAEKYYPRPGVYIDEESSIQPGLPWGGIGIRVEQRGFQWNNPQAKDAVFWEYKIANISDYDIPDVAFGYWVDNGIGGEADDEIGFFDRKIDMAYSWDDNQIGRGGLRTGLMGFAYLESPGIPFDDKDNDDDGLLNEQRDNQAVAKVDATSSIYDLQKFLDTYKLKLEDLKEHWDADEDQDWSDGNDLNGNGQYAFYDAAAGEWVPEAGENSNDDVGTDGVGPFGLNYNGPDADGSECNHRPDYDPAIGSEPNFASTDVSESDMVGLTSFRLFPVPSHSSSYRWFRGDESMWELIGQDSTVEYLGNISNLIETFASGPFPLFQGREERISMSILHAYESNYESLRKDDDHPAPALFAAKRIVQSIYEADYRFAQPPEMPTLSATPGDGKVILTWDNIADTRTRDPFLGNINDFEGYKIYRATDKKFSDAEIITDGFGVPFYKEAIFQCDLQDGIQGFAEYGIVNGATFFLGSETGIVHHHIDRDVVNGRTYYYAIVAYDYGDPEIGGGITPSENTTVIDIDETDNVRSVGQNVAIVVAGTEAPGYTAPSVEEMESENLIGEGSINTEILANNSLQPGHTYKIKFSIDTVKVLPTVDTYDIHTGIYYSTSGLYVYDETAGNKLVYSESKENYAFDNIVDVEKFILGKDDTLRYTTLKTDETIETDVFDGMRMLVDSLVEIAQRDYSKTGWLQGYSDIQILYAQKQNPATTTIFYPYPWDYDIVFTDNDQAYVGQTNPSYVFDEKGTRLFGSKLIKGQAFNFYVENTNFLNEAGEFEKIEMIVHVVNNNGVFDIREDRVLVGPIDEDGKYAGTAFAIDFFGVDSTEELPNTDDVYRIRYRRPFWVTDSLKFTVNEQTDLDKNEITSSMDKIKVVPNPYVATNSMEEAVVNPFLNQPRKLMFTNVPARCTIKIFTVSGFLVDEIKVRNNPETGFVHWDLLTSEGLEIAAGIYIYYVKAEETGDTKLGKFAVVK